MQRLNPFALGLAGLALTTTLATAQTSLTNATGRDAGTLQAMQATKVSLSQAVDTAEQQGSGRAIEAEFEKKENAAGHYEVKVLTKDAQVVKYKIDATSGQVSGTENERFEGLFTRLKPTDLQNAKTSLKQALAIAEQHAGSGKAVDAEVEREGSSVEYEVKVATASGTKEVKVDANGQVKKD